MSNDQNRETAAKRSRLNGILDLNRRAIQDLKETVEECCRICRRTTQDNDRAEQRDTA